MAVLRQRFREKKFFAWFRMGNLVTSCWPAVHAKFAVQLTRKARHSMIIYAPRSLCSLVAK
jgi:hypothetical protein